MITNGNLFAGSAARRAEEVIATLLATPDLKIERIVSHGQASPPGFWYDQAWAEWVVLLSGSATLRFEKETAARELRPGDFLHIPAHARHRVEATDPEHATVWLAVHHR
ncbi:cupin domain-containing protein [Rhodoplanes azumiensis]|uniref:Cupin domain-containing protein n=1 Tax=Rhodoplanes azumiensis TaxID=1897628 RepID=A0ABW5AMP5_9BRAD